MPGAGKNILLLIPQAIQQGGEGGCPAQARKIRILLVHAGGDARAGETILHSVSPTSDSARGEARRRRDFFCICDSHKRISKGEEGGKPAAGGFFLESELYSTRFPIANR